MVEQSALGLSCGSGGIDDEGIVILGDADFDFFALPGLRSCQRISADARRAQRQQAHRGSRVRVALPGPVSADTVFAVGVLKISLRTGVGDEVLDLFACRLRVDGSDGGTGPQPCVGRDCKAQGVSRDDDDAVTAFDSAIDEFGCEPVDRCVVVAVVQCGAEKVMAERVRGRGARVAFLGSGVG